MEHDPHLLSALETLIDPDTRGDPMSLLRWTCNLHSAIRPMRFFSNYLDPSNILNFAIWSDAFSTRGRLLFECRASHGNRSAPPTVVRTFTLVHSLLTDKKSGPGWPRWPRSPAQIFYPHPGWPLSLYLLAGAYLVVARLP